MSLLVATSERERNKAVFDSNSVVPWAIGVAAGVVKANPAVLIISFLAYEAVESGALFYRPHARVESPANRIGDVLVGVLGYAMGEWIRTQRPEWVSEARRHLQGGEQLPPQEHV